jgi:predicted ATP-grasp superfamily ATP-dependent carboligase
MAPETVLVLGNYWQTLTVIRSLGRAGFPVILGRSRDHGRVFTQYSRYTGEVWPHPDMEQDAPAFIEALSGFLNSRPDVRFIFPVWEAEIICLIGHLDRLPQKVVTVMAEPAAVEACLDKFRLYEIGASLGIPLAMPRKATSHDEMLSAADAIGYPCVVKHNDSAKGLFGRKALIAASHEELRQSMPHWPEQTGFLVVQRYTRGVRHNCHFLADAGRLLGYFEQRVHRTDRPDATGHGIDTMSCAPTAMLREHATALIRRLNYSGIGCVQFLVDERNGSVNLLELNPRLDATCALPFYCGYDFPKMALLHAAYRRGLLSAPPEPAATYPAVKRGVSLLGDLNGWLQDRQDGNSGWRQSFAWLARAARLPFRGDVDYVWSWTDPAPGIVRFAEFGLSALKYLARRPVARRRCARESA